MGDGIVDSAAIVHPSRNIQDAIPKIKIPVGFFIPEGSLSSNQYPLTDSILVDDAAWDKELAQKVQQEWATSPDAPKHVFKDYPGRLSSFLLLAEDLIHV